MKRVIKQFSVFGLVGLAGTAAHYALLLLLVSGFAVYPVIASSAGAILGAFINYYLNYRFTFRSNKRHGESMPRFFTVAAIGFLLNGGLMWGATEVWRMHYLLGQILATGIVLMWNYLGNLCWTFSREQT
jgi:putative flippase GtrA